MCMYESKIAEREYLYMVRLYLCMANIYHVLHLFYHSHDDDRCHLHLITLQHLQGIH